MKGRKEFPGPAEEGEFDESERPRRKKRMPQGQAKKPSRRKAKVKRTKLTSVAKFRAVHAGREAKLLHQGSLGTIEDSARVVSLDSRNGR